MKTIEYPIKGRKLEDVVTQNTLDMLVTQLLNWQQGPGVFGNLWLHSCWGTASVLDKRYQGESVGCLSRQMENFRILYEKTGNKKWLGILNAMASHILYLQDPSGAFIHSTNEFEPTFNVSGCPISFFLPIIALCKYYELDYVDEYTKSLIPDAVNRHFEYMEKNIWQIGNAGRGRLNYPGWCGVTNQDFVATAALALCKKCFGWDERFEKYGQSVIDYFLTDNYYYEDIGLFERGDGHNFVERTTYYSHIIPPLETVYSVTKDERLIEVADNVKKHLFDAVFVAEDGLTYLARGAITDAEDKSKVYGWEYGAIAFEGYPEIVTFMEEYVKKYPDPEKEKIVESLKDTIAAYMFSNGNIPLGINNSNPIFSIMSRPDAAMYIQFIMNILGDKMQDPKIVDIPCIHRKHKNMTWKQKGYYWAIEEDDVRKYGGYTRYPAGIAIGPDEKPVEGSFDILENPDIIEIVHNPM